MYYILCIIVFANEFHPRVGFSIFSPHAIMTMSNFVGQILLVKNKNSITREILLNNTFRITLCPDERIYEKEESHKCLQKKKKNQTKDSRGSKSHRHVSWPTGTIMLAWVDQLLNFPLSDEEIHM